jgi:peptidoglycan hydrolase-like protein with peptidoglycan-binding domain
MRVNTGSGARTARVGAPEVPVKVVLARGARGELVRQLQVALKGAGSYKDAIDADFGDLTAKAVARFRAKHGLGRDEVVDRETWRAVTGRSVPPLRERAIAVTAAFEGHGFGLAAGNYDGAGLTWGIIGFTLSSGNVPKLVLEAEARKPGCVAEAFGKKGPELVEIMNGPKTRQFAWANAISSGSTKSKVAEPWRSCFQRFGEIPEVQEIQLAQVNASYFQPAKKTARELGLQSELGIALCFDIHVQNGSISSTAQERIRREVKANAIHKERELRVIVANAVADAARAQYREDVRSRKLTLATGAGKVHGATYVLRNWGLDGSVPEASP